MFTGLIEEVGTLARIETIAGGKRLFITARRVLKDARVDDSIAVNGVCLTVVRLANDGFWVDAVGETLTKTTVGSWTIGHALNLERALRLADRLGGHLVQGHVNGVGRVVALQKLGENYALDVEVPPDLLRYIILEGSIALDGISLTVARLQDNRVGISVIPHTMQATNLSTKKVGDLLNVEVDVLAKYVERLLMFSQNQRSKSKLTEEWLKQLGF